MAVFNLGPTGLTVAQPAEPGPAAEALARARSRARSRCSTARPAWTRRRGGWPATGCRRRSQGVRNTGERAILVGPEHAGGAYVGFVGPA